MDPRRLLTFREVANQGSFSRAGEALALTQPAVSQQVASLERQLGVKLLERGPGGPTPTAAGALLLAHADAVADRLAQADEQIAELADAERETLRVGAFPSALATLVPSAVAALRAQEPDAEVLWPVHPNPHVKALASEILGNHPRVHLAPPLDYDVFAVTLAHARAVLSDSGGIQEEAPSLGKRVLVARETTERPEAIESGHNRLVGRDRGKLRDALLAAWHEPPYAGPVPAPNPYGDGRAGARIAAILADELHLATAR